MNSPSSPISRRDFVKSGSAVIGGAVLAASSGQARAGESAGVTQVPQVVLGRTGAKVSRLGIGCAYFQRKRVTPDDVTRTLTRASSWA